MTVSQLVRIQHSENEETEFYPTTQEIVDAVAEDILKDRCYASSILDIGCGNGNFFSRLKKSSFGDRKVSKYGIEKSFILTNELPDDIIIIGTNFYEQTLIDKKVDCIFCNPPYSDFENWSSKIIREGNTKLIYLVIPTRWKSSETIKESLEKRNFNTEILGTFSFENAERKARAVVDLVRIAPRYHEKYGYSDCSYDAFDVWFDENFKINAQKEESSFYSYTSEKKKKIQEELVSSENTAQMLVEFYERDLMLLYKNYRALENLDGELLQELHVNIKNLKESLKLRVQGLKSLYWSLLFQRYNSITSRLTSSCCQRVTDKLNDNTSIDFTLENIFQLTMWIIRHSNSLFDQQLTDFFYSLCNEDSIRRYKSNLRWHDDEWKYIKSNCRSWGGRNENYIKTIKNIMLDYRIISEGCSNFEYNSWDKSYRNRFTNEFRNFYNDLIIIAGNLGFRVVAEEKVSEYDFYADFDEWKNKDIYLEDGELFCNLKLYKNGNRHIKFSQKFMEKLNIEMARINHWINDRSQAAREFNLPEEYISQLWNSNCRIQIEAAPELLGIGAPA